MEQYQGVKFSYDVQSSELGYDDRLVELNRWVCLLADLGLTPLHPSGAFGNQSLRTGEKSFIITRSGMTPEDHFRPENFTLVEHYIPETSTFHIHGHSPPSSESILHHCIYQANHSVTAILHGHCDLFNRYARPLKIPVTAKFCDYGTIELAESALATMRQSGNFFLLRDHGFVALGSSIDDAGRLVLDRYQHLIAHLAAAF